MTLCVSIRCSHICFGTVSLAHAPHSGCGASYLAQAQSYVQQYVSNYTVCSQLSVYDVSALAFREIHASASSSVQALIAGAMKAALKTGALSLTSG